MSQEDTGPQGWQPQGGDADPLVGRVLGDRYRVIRSLGAGGMAAVYMAEHQLIGRQVAIKMPHPQYAADEDLVRRFLKEGRAAGMLGHPNIAACTDMGYMPDGSPFLVFEYLEGSTLSTLIDAEAPLHPVRAARIALQIASALAAAHAARIVHRDLKPDNVFIVRREDGPELVKVLDFGLSKFFASDQSESGTLPGTVMGTPMYMAPEQILAPLHVDERVDIYALGVILYHMLSGWPPFNTLPASTLLERVVNVIPRPLTGRYADLAPGFADLVQRALDKDREKRPASMRAFEAELRLYANLSSPTLDNIPAIVPPPDAVLRPPPPTPPLPYSAATPLPYSAATPLPYSAATPQPLPAGTAPLQPTAALPAPAAAAPPPQAKPAPPPQAEAPPPPAPRAPAPLQAKAPRPLAKAPPPPVPAPKRRRWIDVVGLIIVLAATAAGLFVLRSPSFRSKPGTVTLSITSPTPGATATFRGNTFPLPYEGRVAAGTSPETVEISAPGHATRRELITLDAPRHVDVVLAPEPPPGGPSP